MPSLFNWQYAPSHAKKRIAVVIFLLIVGFLIMTIRLFSLAFVYSDKNVRISFTQDKTVFRREITDRNGALLATNLPTASIFAHPKQISDPITAAQQLSQALPDLQYSDLLEQLKQNKNFVWIRRDVSPTEQQIVKSLGINGIDSIKDHKRFYTHSSILSHLIGYVDRDGKGLAGIERGLEDLIQDKNLKDIKIPLSIDINIQNIVNEELKAGRQKFDAKAGSAIVADVKTGEILAFVNEPNFNPHKIDPLDLESLENRNTFCVYELGSIFKPIVVAIALDTGAVDLHDVYDITALKVGKKIITDYAPSSGWYTLAQILAKSSNKGISKIALEIGQETMRKYFEDLGLFDVVPNLEILEKAKPIYKKHWSNLDICTTAFGYGISMTPMHYIQAMIPLINGGKLLPLTLLKRDQAPEGVKVLQNEATSEKMRILFRLTVKKGICSAAGVPGQDVGGKTGTANKLVDGQYCSTRVRCSIFAAFPMHDPKYAIHLTLDEPQTPPNQKTATAARTVAPIIGQIISRIATKYGMEPQSSSYDQWDYLMQPPELNSDKTEKE